MNILLVISLTLFLFLSMILMLASKPKFSARMTGAFIAVAAVSGLLFYGYGFAVTIGDWRLATLRALICVCKMFVGSMDLDAIAAAPLMQKAWAQILFWIVHLMALYATASTAIATVGAQALRRLRLWLARWGQLNLIYGVNEDTLSLGRQLMQTKGCTVIFIDNNAQAEAAAISQMGCILRTNDSALAADKKFLCSIGGNRRNRKITLYAMQPDSTSNKEYATRLRDTMAELPTQPVNTQLVIRCQENSDAIQLQQGKNYGYASVSLVQESNLAARVLMREYPPCKTIPFDDNCRAEEDFEAIIVGFGQMGQAVLRQLVMNSQFEGSHFHAAVFSLDCESVKGPFSKKLPMVLTNYDIDFHLCDARSEAMYDYLETLGKKLKYLVICTGSDRMNNELAENLVDFLHPMGLTIPIFTCSQRGVYAFPINGGTVVNHQLYQPQLLSMEKIDAMARILNHHYKKDPPIPVSTTWRACDYFDRMSNRAAADFIPSHLHMAKTSEDAVLEKGLNLEQTQMENLGRTEHLRWCAFHYCMGYTPMTDKEYCTRTETHLQQVKNGEKEYIRTAKNKDGRTHACLIPWEALDEFSARENKVIQTAKEYDPEYKEEFKNYKENDFNNIRVIPKLLKTLKDNEEKKGFFHKVSQTLKTFLSKEEVPIPEAVK